MGDGKTDGGRRDAFRASRTSLRLSERAVRSLDVCLVLLMLPLVVPVALVIAVGILLDSPGPLLYRAARVGQGGRVFKMLKFRTMVQGATGPPLRVAGDSRQTPFGRTLARTRLDELPQLLNVLRGEMRLIGPRPEAPEFVAMQPTVFAEVLAVPPGLTGPTQLLYQDEPQLLAALPASERTGAYVKSILPSKLALDLEFVRRGPHLADLVLLARTAVVPAGRQRRAGMLRPDARGRLVAVTALVFFTLFLAEAATPL